MQTDLPQFISTFIATLLSSTVVGTVLTFIFQRRITKITEEVKSEIKRTEDIRASQRTWQEKSVSELLGPLYMQLDRTNRAMDRWQQENTYLEAKVVREANISIRDLLLAKGSLIPQELLEDAGRLISHYDHWLEEFEKIRGKNDPSLDQSFPFVFTYDFPKGSDKRFMTTFKKMQTDLYGENAQLSKTPIH